MAAPSVWWIGHMAAHFVKCMPNLLLVHVVNICKCICDVYSWAEVLQWAGRCARRSAAQRPDH